MVLSKLMAPANRQSINLLSCLSRTSTSVLPRRVLIIQTNSLYHNHRTAFIPESRFVLFVPRRNFVPPNNFNPSKRPQIVQIFVSFFQILPVLMMIYFTFNWSYLWYRVIPEYFTNPIKVAYGNTKGFFVMKKADSLAKDNGNSNEQNLTEIPNMFYNVFQFLNINKKNEDLRVGGFRDKKVIEYENRIRLYSNPDKIFRYFATVKIIYNNKESELYMTPDDFLRALTPGIKQPEGYGLDQFRVIDLTKDKKSVIHSGLKANSIFYKLSRYGLINFSDFLFLLTVISVSKRHFEIAFRMFDLNDDGDVEYEEFAKVQNAILAQTSIGKKMGKATRYKGVSSAVSKYFFGEDLKSRLTIEHFIEFQQVLQNELLTLEFDRKKPNQDGYIREIDFADLLVAYAALSEKKRVRMIKRVQKKFSEENSIGISQEEYLNFFRFLQNINDVDIALAVYHIAGASIDQATLKHVAQTVAHVELSDHLVDVVFTLFDEDDDGQLSNKEFISVMKERLRRGLSKPKDTGLLRIMATIWKSLTSLNF